MPRGAHGKSEMHILFVPDFSRVNAYQRELAEALERRGARISMSNGIGRFPLLGAMGACDEPDVLHLHWTHPLMVSATGSRWKTLGKSLRLVLELLWLKARRTTLVWTVHNLASHEQSNWQIELLFNRICARLYDYLIVHCNSAKEAVVQTYLLPEDFKARMAVIPLGSYMPSYENAITRKQARDDFGYRQRDTVFLFFGLIRTYKGVFDLISAFGELDYPQAQLLIAGKPVNQELKRKLEDQMCANERITGRLTFIPDDEIQCYMNAADVVALPYRDVLTPSTAVLAMSFGKAVIAPRLGCVGELLDDRGAFLYDADQDDGLVDAMRQALSANLADMGRHNLEQARQLDWDDIAQKTCEVYQRCLP